MFMKIKKANVHPIIILDSLKLSTLKGGVEPIIDDPAPNPTPTGGDKPKPGKDN
jgi:hypothetical protein